jgi:subfamily B ATP-binding cassette protein MsbA
MQGFGRLLGFVRPYRGLWLATFVAAVVASVLDGFTLALLIPFLRVLFATAGNGGPEAFTFVERVLDTLIGFALTPDRGAALRNVMVVIVGAVVVKNVAVYVTGSLGARIQEGVARDLRSAVYGRLLQVELGFYGRVKGGQVLSRVMADVDQARHVVGRALVSAVQNVLLVVVYLAILCALSWRLTLLALALAPAIALAMRPILSRIRARGTKALDDRGEITAIVAETVEGARLIRAYGAEDHERRRFGKAIGRYFRGMVRAEQLGALAHPVSETLGAVVLLLLLAIGVLGASDGGMRPEVFIPFVAITLRLLSPVKALSQFPARAELWLAAAARVFEVLDEPEEDVDAPRAARFAGFDREIRFAQVWFRYDEHAWVLRGVDLTVRHGEVIAVVGPSGAGKSTLVDLLPRFVDPTRGSVSIDGVPISAYDRRSLRRTMGIVSQRTVIFHETVRANIAYGDEAGVSDDAVEAAAQAANAHDFIMRLPQGYDTVLGDRGMRLSGGERQRIAIARALLKDPPILILDEATSALDAEAERAVQQAIARLLERRTVLVIAHRLSTVARADRIVVLDGGRLVEQGRHDELVASGGLYRRFHMLDVALPGA